MSNVLRIYMYICRYNVFITDLHFQLVMVNQKSSDPDPTGSAPSNMAQQHRPSFDNKSPPLRDEDSGAPPEQQVKELKKQLKKLKTGQDQHRPKSLRPLRYTEVELNAISCQHCHLSIQY